MYICVHYTCVHVCVRVRHRLKMLSMMLCSTHRMALFAFLYRFFVLFFGGVELLGVKETLSILSMHKFVSSLSLLLFVILC